MYHSLRKSDAEKERILNVFLDKYLFRQKYFSNVDRKTDIENQINGIDVQLDIDDLNLKNINIDEKAQLHYLDGGLPTFAFELIFRNRNLDFVLGWLMDATKLTTHYLLYFVKTKDGKSLNNVEDIIYVEYLLISKIKLIKYLEEEDLTQTKLTQMAYELKNKESGAHHKSNQLPYYFFYSDQLAEKPVNLIIRKKKLYELALLKGKITSPIQ